MAAITPNTDWLPQQIHARDDQGLKHWIGYFEVADADTWTSGIKNIKDVWWRGNAADESVAATVNTTTGVVTFNTSGVTRAGYLLVRYGG